MSGIQIIGYLDAKFLATVNGTLSIWKIKIYQAN